MQTILSLLFLHLSTPSAGLPAGYLPIDTIAPAYPKNYTPPAFPGGEKAFRDFIDQHLLYPKHAYQKNIHGNVEVQFTIDENGNIINPQLTGTSQHPALAKEAIRLVNLFPSWAPGTIDGKPVSTLVPLTIHFPPFHAGGDLANVPDPGAIASEAYKPSFKTVTEVAPAFPGGDEGLFNYLRRHLHYPIEALRADIEGTVTVNFTISEAGQVVDATTEGPKLGGHLELEALRLVRSMPKWSPGTNAGKPVAVACTFPLHFQLLDYKAKKQRRRIYPTY